VAVVMRLVTCHHGGQLYSDEEDVGNTMLAKHAWSSWVSEYLLSSLWVSHTTL